jgi:hypothetical protein
MKTRCKYCKEPAKFYCLECGHSFYCKMHPCNHIAPEQITDITPIDSYPSLKTHVEMILRHERETKRRGIAACFGGAALGIVAITALATGGIVFAIVLALLSAYTAYWGYVRIA